MFSTIHVLVFLAFLALVVRGTRFDEDRHHRDRKGTVGRSSARSARSSTQ